MLVTVVSKKLSALIQGEKVLPDGVSIAGEGYSLAISSAASHQSGRFTCTATNPVASDSQTIVLSVMGLYITHLLCLLSG